MSKNATQDDSLSECISKRLGGGKWKLDHREPTKSQEAKVLVSPLSWTGPDTADYF